MYSEHFAEPDGSVNTRVGYCNRVHLICPCFSPLTSCMASYVSKETTIQWDPYSSGRENTDHPGAMHYSYFERSIRFFNIPNAEYRYLIRKTTSSVTLSVKQLTLLFTTGLAPYPPHSEWTFFHRAKEAVPTRTNTHVCPLHMYNAFQPCSNCLKYIAVIIIDLTYTELECIADKLCIILHPLDEALTCPFVCCIYF